MPIIPDPIDWLTVENTLYDWFAEQSGLPTVWGNQDSPQPDYPFGTITIITGGIQLGGADEIRYETDLGQPAGEEVKIEFVGLRSFVLSCQVHIDPLQSMNASNHARHIMSRVQTSLAAPSVCEQFASAGIAINRQGNVETLDLVIEDTWIARAGLDVLLSVASNSFERTGYIECVEIDAPPPFNWTDEPFGDC